MESENDLDIIRHMFREYETELDVNLCFQNFEDELASLPGDYTQPQGFILLASLNTKPAGCVALRKIGDAVCEMKRMFVRPEFRSSGLGRLLSIRLIEEARKLGYTRMRLDTLQRLQPAIKLYESLGFREIPSYYDNPLEHVKYMELEL